MSNTQPERAHDEEELEDDKKVGRRIRCGDLKRKYLNAIEIYGKGKFISLVKPTMLVV